MRFKDGVREFVGNIGQRLCAFGAVVFDAVVVEFDAGLDDEADDARPDVIAQAVRGEGFAVDAVGSAGGVRRGRGDTVEGFFGAARYGDFGADDVHEWHGFRHGGAGIFGDAAEAGSAFGDGGIR